MDSAKWQACSYSYLKTIKQLQHEETKNSLTVQQRNLKESEPESASGIQFLMRNTGGCSFGVLPTL
ncbi:hypothetical protein T4E_9871 [Trichinella pseudospiralis]|uniref:Uncharacterized protein n=1 Tax=Trichinella pseudospiralis TaxID=6337 RepID=A0A0V0Y4F4_TRIPS|nr:hypothetical protein T4E_9871 [Trichinella pseudospiralis]